MEWWAIFLMIIVLITLVVCIIYFVLKIYFPYHFATFNYHIDTRGHYASNEPPTLATFRSKSEGDIIFTETGCYAKQTMGLSKGNVSASKEDLPVTTDSTILLDTIASRLGQLQVGLDVDYDTSELIVLVIEGKKFDIPENTDIKLDLSSCDFYVCVDLIHFEDTISSAKTRILEKDTSPTYKERFLFKVNIPDLQKKVVRFRVVAVSKGDKHTEISKAALPISDVDLTKAKRLWLNLKEMTAEDDVRGELMVSLTFLPSASRITLVIIKAKSLKWKIPRQKTGDVMINVSMISNGRRVCKRQTSVKRRTKDPIFNESLIFSTSNPNENMYLRISVSEILPTGRMYTIGHCILGPTSSGSELTHWQQMLSNPRRPSAMWHWLHKTSKKQKDLKSSKNGNNSGVVTSDSEHGLNGTDLEDGAPQTGSDLINL